MSENVGVNDREATPRPRLDRGRVLAAAIELIDESGVRVLSMRKVGRRLGVEAMALYRYVPSRESLLDGVVETVVDELYAEPDVHLLATDGWPEYVARHGHGVRRIALRHPQVFPLIASRPPAAPWVRPPLRSLRWVEAFLGGLMARGFSERDAVHAYQAFASFLLGHLLLEVSSMGVDTGPVEEDDEAPAHAPDPVDSYPLLLRLAPQLAADHFTAEFEESLANLISRIGPGVAR